MADAFDRASYAAKTRWPSFKPVIPARFYKERPSPVAVRTMKRDGPT